MDLIDPVAAMADQLARVRPGLSAAYAAAVPGARAAVLARVWGAVAREPFPAVRRRQVDAGLLRVGLVDGTQVVGPATLAEPFALAEPGVSVAGSADPVALLSAVGGGRLAAEIGGSVAGLALARAGAGAAVSLAELAAWGPAAGLVAAEQAVVDGHPLHPSCRFRGGFTAADVLAYAPEHRPVVELVLLAVPAQRWLTTGVGLPPVLPVHPWQVDRVRAAYPWLRDTGERVAALPLMSLRTLAVAAELTRHVKTAVPAQMTSAVRIVSPAAVRNGPVVCGLLALLAQRVPGFEVLAEEAAGAVLVDGAPVRELAVVQRRFVPTAGAVTVPLAALSAVGPAGAAPLAVQAVRACGGDPVAWLSALAEVVLRPVLTLLGWGVALEAHGQNTLVALAGGRPVRMLYRDVGGVRISARRLAARGVSVPALWGDIPTEDPVELRTKVAAAVAVPFGELCAVLGRFTAVEPAVLWQAVSTVARGVLAQTTDAALLAGPLPVKATLAMRLADDPLADQWAALPYGWGDEA